LNGAAFGRVFKQAGKSSDDLFTILWRPNGKGIARLGMAISKKNVRRAVDRNLVKRLTRESFRHHQRALRGIDLVVLGRRGLPKAERSEIRRSLGRHWENIIRRLERNRGSGNQVP
jgi:ribonuclease P protein component